MNVIAKKTKAGWEAEDRFDFEGARRLSIRTYKIGGKLTTYATVNKYTEHGFQHVFGLGGGGDWSERVIVSDARATAKSVADQHAQALARVPEFLEKARAHYAKHPAKD